MKCIIARVLASGAFLTTPPRALATFTDDAKATEAALALNAFDGVDTRFEAAPSVGLPAEPVSFIVRDCTTDTKAGDELEVITEVYQPAGG